MKIEKLIDKYNWKIKEVRDAYRKELKEKIQELGLGDRVIRTTDGRTGKLLVKKDSSSVLRTSVVFRLDNPEIDAIVWNFEDLEKQFKKYEGDRKNEK